MQTVLPEAKLGVKTLFGVKGSDRLVAYQADRSSYGPSESIKLNISQTDYLLPRSSFFQFKAYATSTDTTAHFKNSIASIIRRVRIMVGGKDLELVDQYGQLHQMLELVQDDSTYDNVETYAINYWASGAPAAAKTRDHNVGSRKWTEGVGSDEERIAWKAERTYTLKLYTGFLQMNKLVPLWALGDKVRIEIDLAPAVECCLATSATGLTYTVNDFKFMGHIHSMPSSYNMMVEQEIAKNGIEYLFPSFDYQSVKVTGTSNNITLSCKRRSIKFLLAAFRRVANQIATDAEPAFIRALLQEYQMVTSSGNVNPSSPLEVGAPSLMEVRRCFGKINGNSDKLDQLTYSQYAVDATATRFMVGMELESFMSQDVITGTDGLAEDLVLQLKHSSAVVDSDTYAHIYCLYDVSFKIGAGFVHEIKQ